MQMRCSSNIQDYFPGSKREGEATGSFFQPIVSLKAALTQVSSLRYKGFCPPEIMACKDRLELSICISKATKYYKPRKL